MKVKKNKKHHKKHSKQTKEKKQHASESSSESMESEETDEWVEKPTTSKALTTNRDEEKDSWMDIIASSTYSRNDRTTPKVRREEEAIKKLGLDKPGQHAKELNPYWKDGGCGLPTTNAASASTAVGDGGLKWLQKAYQRSVEQAREENRSLEDVVAERWGSLENLEKMIDEASQKVQDQRGSFSPRHSKNSRKYHSREHRHDSHHRRPNRDDDSRYEARSSGLYTKKGNFIAPTEDIDISYSNKPLISNTSSVPRWKKKTIACDPPPSTYSKSDSFPSLEKASSSFEKIEKQPSPESTVTESEEKISLTDKEMNELGAKLIKAEIMGNTELAIQLKAKLDSAHKSRDNEGSNRTNHKSETKEVILLMTDNKGLTRPLQARQGISERDTSRRKKRQKIDTHDKEGVRERYFADDDKYSLKQMFEREKLSTAEDQDAMFARLAGKGVGRTSDDYDLDDALTSRANRVVSEAKIEEGERLRAIMEYKKTTAALERCRYCFEGKENPKHLIVAAGMKVYLRVPDNHSLTDGQCIIVPMQHSLGSTYLDEDVLDEIKIFRKGLTAMYKAQDLDVVYFECCMNLRRHPHMTVHCVPLPKDVGHLAPMYFKKAILESETEWAHNKKLVEINQKGIQKSVPKGLPYFSVEFGLDGGFAHVIEDEQLFPQTFAEEIIGGMLDLDPNAWRRPQRQQFEEQRKKVLKLSEWWRPYDWTSRLRESGKGEA